MRRSRRRGSFPRVLGSTNYLGEEGRTGRNVSLTSTDAHSSSFSSFRVEDDKNLPVRLKSDCFGWIERVDLGLDRRKIEYRCFGNAQTSVYSTFQYQWIRFQWFRSDETRRFYPRGQTMHRITARSTKNDLSRCVCSVRLDATLFFCSDRWANRTSLQQNRLQCRTIHHLGRTVHLPTVEFRRKGRYWSTSERNLISHSGETPEDPASIPVLDHRSHCRSSLPRLGQRKTTSGVISRQQAFVFLGLQDGTISVWTPTGDLKVTKSIAVSEESMAESDELNIPRRRRALIKRWLPENV